MVKTSITNKSCSYSVLCHGGVTVGLVIKRFPYALEAGISFSSITQQNSEMNTVVSFSK